MCARISNATMSQCKHTGQQCIDGVKMREADTLVLCYYHLTIRVRQWPAK